MKIVKKIILILILIAMGYGVWYLWQEHQSELTEPEEIEQAIEQEYNIDDLPDYSGEPSVAINRGSPAFAKEDLKTEFFEEFSELDDKGRCGPATACVDKGHMPLPSEVDRGEIEQIKPSGWKGGKYDFIENGGFLYNRCHLIGWQLTGENAEARNLITGTRYMNVEGMLPYENQIARYVRKTGNHVMVRVTPVFLQDELLCRGVQIEAQSVEDQGEGVKLNVYCYNVQPGVAIDYKTGENWLAEEDK